MLRRLFVNNHHSFPVTFSVYTLRDSPTSDRRERVVVDCYTTNDSLIPASETQKDSVEIRFSITTQEKAIKRIGEEIQEEEGWTKECDDVIADLKAAIPDGVKHLL